MSQFGWLYKLPSNALMPVLCACSDARHYTGRCPHLSFCLPHQECIARSYVGLLLAEIVSVMYANDM